ncbi:MAG: hypothetical protein BIFFINMI_00190 [Phycisphaerae bacterium]|nr:hypothetical protein [Phycisphaerae bacterium]
MLVAMIHSGALGDLILTLPVAQTLCAEEAECVELFAVEGRALFLAGRSAVTAGHSLEGLPLTELFRDDFDSSRAPEIVRATFRGFEDVINAYPSEKFARNLAAASMTHIRSLDTRPTSIEHGGVHATEFLHRQLFGNFVQVPTPSVTPTDEDRAYGLSALAALGDKPRLLIHHGSGSPAKCWPLPQYVKLAEQMQADGWGAAFVLGEAEHETIGDDDWKMLQDRFTTFTGLDLEQLGGLIAASDAYIGNDSGPSHLAAAIGTPTFAIFGPTNPEVWAPRGRSVKVIRGLPSEPERWRVDPARVAVAIQSTVGAKA